MVLHHESKEFPVDELTVAKGGSKLKETEDPNVEPLTPAAGPPKPDKNGLPQLNGSGAIVSIFPGANGATATMVARGLPSSEIAIRLANLLRRPVIDKTGLTGKYDFALEFTPDLSGIALPAGFSAQDGQQRQRSGDEHRVRRRKAARAEAHVDQREARRHRGRSRREGSDRKLDSDPLIGPIRSRARGRALAFDSDKHAAAEKERQPPVERARIASAHVIERGVGRTEQRRRIRNGEHNVRRNRSRGCVWIRAAIDRREVCGGGRAIEARLLAAGAAIRKSAGCRVQKKQTIRSAIDETAGIRDAVESGGEVAKAVDGLSLRAVQRIVGLRANAEYQGSRYRCCPAGRNLRKNDEQAVIILWKHPDGVLQLFRHAHGSDEATGGGATEIDGRG